MATSDTPQERLDEIKITKAFNVGEALSSIQFYWNLARQRGETIVVEIWAKRGAVVSPRLEVPEDGRIPVEIP